MAHPAVREAEVSEEGVVRVAFDGLQDVSGLIAAIADRLERLRVAGNGVDLAADLAHHVEDVRAQVQADAAAGLQLAVSPSGVGDDLIGPPERVPHPGLHVHLHLADGASLHGQSAASRALAVVRVFGHAEA